MWKKQRNRQSGNGGKHVEKIVSSGNNRPDHYVNDPHQPLDMELVKHEIGQLKWLHSEEVYDLEWQRDDAREQALDLEARLALKIASCKCNVSETEQTAAKNVLLQRVQQLEQDKKTLRSKLLAVQSLCSREMSQSGKKISQLTQELWDIKEKVKTVPQPSEGENVLSPFSSKFQAKETELARQLLEQQTWNKDLQNKLLSSESEKATLENTVQNLLAELSVCSLKWSAAEQHLQATAGEKEELQRQLAVCEADKEVALSNGNLQKEQNVVLQKGSTDLRERLSLTEQKVEALIAQREALKSDVCGKDKLYQSLSVDLVLKEIEVQRLTSENEGLLSAKEQLADKLQKLSEENQSLKDAMHALMEEQSLKLKKVSLKLQKSKEKAASLTETFGEKLHGIKQENGWLQRELAKATNKFQQTEQQYTELETMNEELKKRCSVAAEEISKRDVKAESLVEEISHLKRTLEIMVGNLASSQQEKEDLSLTHQAEVRLLVQHGDELQSRVDTLEADKNALQSQLNSKESELFSVKNRWQETESLFNQEREKRDSEIMELNEKLDKRTSDEQKLYQRMLEDQFNVIQEIVREAENIVQDAVAKLDDPLHVRCTSSPDYLVNLAQTAMDALPSLENGRTKYVHNIADASPLVGALTRFAHLTADTILNGNATSHLASPAHRDQLKENCRECGNRSLQYLEELKNKQSLKDADLGKVRRTLKNIIGLREELRPKSLDIRPDEPRETLMEFKLQSMEVNGGSQHKWDDGYPEVADVPAEPDVKRSLTVIGSSRILAEKEGVRSPTNVLIGENEQFARALLKPDGNGILMDAALHHPYDFEEVITYKSITDVEEVKVSQKQTERIDCQVPSVITGKEPPGYNTPFRACSTETEVIMSVQDITQFHTVVDVDVKPSDNRPKHNPAIWEITQSKTQMTKGWQVSHSLYTSEFQSEMGFTGVFLDLQNQWGCWLVGCLLQMTWCVVKKTLDYGCPKMFEHKELMSVKEAQNDTTDIEDVNDPKCQGPSAKNTAEPVFDSVERIHWFPDVTRKFQSRNHLGLLKKRRWGLWKARPPNMHRGDTPTERLERNSAAHWTERGTSVGNLHSPFIAQPRGFELGGGYVAGERPWRGISAFLCQSQRLCWCPAFGLHAVAGVQCRFCNSRPRIPACRGLPINSWWAPPGVSSPGVCQRETHSPRESSQVDIRERQRAGATEGFQQSFYVWNLPVTGRHPGRAVGQRMAWCELLVCSAGPEPQDPKL